MLADTEEGAQFAIQMQPLYHQVATFIVIILSINLIISTEKCSILILLPNLPSQSHSTCYINPFIIMMILIFHDDHDGLDNYHDGDGVNDDHDGCNSLEACNWPSVPVDDNADNLNGHDDQTSFKIKSLVNKLLQNFKIRYFLSQNIRIQHFLSPKMAYLRCKQTPYFVPFR